MTKLTKAQRARLEKLAAYLEGLPKSYRHFNMAIFYRGDEEARYARHNGGLTSCGTAACAAGHGPAAGILVPPRFVSSSIFFGPVDWAGYCSLFVGENSARGGWCFDGDWDMVDNSHWGAAARIRYLLDKGAPPEDYGVPRRAQVALYAPYRIDAKVPA